MHSVANTKERPQTKVKELISQVESLLDQSDEKHVVIICLLALSVCMKDETPYMFNFMNSKLEKFKMVTYIFSHVHRLKPSSHFETIKEIVKLVNIYLN